MDMDEAAEWFKQASEKVDEAKRAVDLAIESDDFSKIDNLILQSYYRHRSRLQFQK